MATRYEYYIAGDDTGLACRSSIWVGQQFTIGTIGANETHNLTSIKLYGYTVGNIITLLVKVYAVDGDGKPTGSPLSSGSKAYADLPTTSNWVEITMSSCVLQETTQYAIVVYTEYSDADIYWIWRRDVTSPTYGGGTGLYSVDSGSSWSVVDNQDRLFEEWGEVSGGYGEKVLGVVPAKVCGIEVSKILKVVA